MITAEEIALVRRMETALAAGAPNVARQVEKRLHMRWREKNTGRPAVPEQPGTSTQSTSPHHLHEIRKRHS